MGKKVVIILLVIVGLIGFGVWKLVGVFEKAGTLAGAEVERFHTLYNEGKAADIYAASAPAFREATKLEAFQDLANRMHEGLGKVKSAERNGIEVKNNNGNKIIVMGYAVVFEKGTAKESFTYDYNGDKPLLLHFELKPDEQKSDVPKSDVPKADAPKPDAPLEQK